MIRVVQVVKLYLSFFLYKYVLVLQVAFTYLFGLIWFGAQFLCGKTVSVHFELFSGFFFTIVSRFLLGEGMNRKKLFCKEKREKKNSKNDQIDSSCTLAILLRIVNFHRFLFIYLFITLFPVTVTFKSAVESTQLNLFVHLQHTIEAHIHTHSLWQDLCAQYIRCLIHASGDQQRTRHSFVCDIESNRIWARLWLRAEWGKVRVMLDFFEWIKNELLFPLQEHGTHSHRLTQCNIFERHTVTAWEMARATVALHYIEGMGVEKKLM